MKYVWLIGDYLNSLERQRQAKELGCNLVLDFHFNSNGPDAIGGEVWYKPGDQPSLNVAQAILHGYKELSLPIHGKGIGEAVKGTRPAWIRHYEMPSVELEPLFVSNLKQAQWIHKEENLDALAKMLADVALTSLPTNSTVGFSIGHLFKSPTSTDKGAHCRLGDYEADHGSALAHKVANIIMGEHDGGTHLEHEGVLLDTMAETFLAPGNVDVARPDNERVQALWKLLCFVVNDLDSEKPEATKQNIRRFMMHMAWHEGAQIKKRSQNPSGPGRSFFQMEPEAAIDGLEWANQQGWISKLATSSGKSNQQIIDGWQNLSSDGWPTDDTTIEQCLLNYDLFGAYLARIKLKRESAAIPASNADQANYWADHWKIKFSSPDDRKQKIGQFMAGANTVDPMMPSNCT